MGSVALIVLLALTAPLRGADQQPGGEAARYFTDVTLINRDGRRVRLYSDLLKEKVVVINSFFASCVTVCPPMMAKLAHLQSVVGDRLGRDVLFLSITVDPKNDTPPRLQAYASRYAASPGWYMLTGSEQNVRWALDRVGQFVEVREEHSTLLIVGHEKRGVWRRVPSTAKVEQIVRVLEQVLSVR